jgi:hypothetical protein
MKPGEACNSCHKVGGAATGKVFDIGGKRLWFIEDEEVVTAPQPEDW